VEDEWDDAVEASAHEGVWLCEDTGTEVADAPTAAPRLLTTGPAFTALLTLLSGPPNVPKSMSLYRWCAFFFCVLGCSCAASKIGIPSITSEASAINFAEFLDFMVCSYSGFWCSVLVLNSNYFGGLAPKSRPPLNRARMRAAISLGVRPTSIAFTGFWFSAAELF
jgi:hypothetical protein